MNPKNKKVAQDLLDGKVDIQEIEDRLFSIAFLSMADDLELDGQRLSSKRKLELNSYLAGEALGLMGNSPEVLNNRIYNPDYLAKMGKLIEKAFVDYMNMSGGFMMNKYDLYPGMLATPAELAKVFTWRFRSEVLGIQPLDSNSFYVRVKQLNGHIISIKANQKIKYVCEGKWLVVVEKS